MLLAKASSPPLTLIVPTYLTFVQNPPFPNVGAGFTTIVSSLTQM
ncbi:MAG: hypothetical protein ACLFVV_26555 [Coleofasciculus sp.]